MNRRTVLSSMTAAALLSMAKGRGQSQTTNGRAPVFFEPWQFGAVGDGQKLDSPAINRAIDACTKAGGGVVYLRPGIYLSGTVILKSNVTLYLEAGSVILGSLNIDDYSREPGPTLLGDANQRHVIFAKDAENLTIAGTGRIDGQGSHFWIPSGRTPLSEDDQWAEVAAHAWLKNPSGRASPMLEFVNCRGLRIEDIHIDNAAGWTLRPINCDNVFITGVVIKNQNIGPNTDGMDLTGCQNVFVSNCSIETGDDAICLKSENPYGSEPRLAKNIVITNCTLTTCCNGFKLGTATFGGFENITFSNSVIYNNTSAYKDRVIAGSALEVVDGGWIEGVVITGIQMQRARTPIFIRLGNRNSGFNYRQNGIRGVMIENIHASECLLASSITGVPGRNVEDITIQNIRVDNVLPSRPEWPSLHPAEKEKNYPEARMFDMLPVSGLYARHVRGLNLRDVSFRSTPSENRPTIHLEDVRGASIRGFSTTAISGSQPLVSVVDTSDVWIRDAAAPDNTESFLAAKGESSSNILVSGSDLRGVRNPLTSDSKEGAVTMKENVER